MARSVAKKFIWHLVACLLVWGLVRALLPEGRLYAGWMAGFLGACYLLAAWLAWLRGRGTDLGALLRRKRPPEAPYYLRAEKDRKPRLSALRGSRHFFDDDLEDAVDAADPLPRREREQVRFLAFLATGLAMMTLSFF